MTQRFIFMFCLVLAGCASAPKADQAAAKATEKGGKAKAAAVKETKKAKEVVEHKAEETKAAVKSAGTVTCKSGSDERLLAVVATEAGGCEVKYTKFGQEASAGNSANGVEHCNGISEKIQKNLMASGYKCE